MAKATTNNQSPGDAISQTNQYFEMLSSGATIADICRSFGKSRNTVIKYLEMHPDYERKKGVFGKPGAGYSKTVAQGRKHVSKKKLEGTKVYFYLPKTTRAKLDQCPGKDRRTKIITAIENYLELPAAKRPKPILRGTKADPLMYPIMDDKLVKKLDRTKGDRTGKVIAAIEMFIDSHL